MRPDLSGVSESQMMCPTKRMHSDSKKWRSFLALLFLPAMRGVGHLTSLYIRSTS
jgi:hypothetical protein